MFFKTLNSNPEIQMQPKVIPKFIYYVIDLASIMIIESSI